MIELNGESTKTSRRGSIPLPTLRELPLVVTAIAVIIGGVFLLDRADEQARDTVRKHHLQDIEQSLYFARGIHGTYPPYEEATWCGELNNSANETVRSQIETVLRQQNNKYGNEAKPFPTDPLYAQDGTDYFYWKRSPAVFELYAVLEQDPNHERNTLRCKNADDMFYDYGINSRWRENVNHLTS